MLIATQSKHELFTQELAQTVIKLDNTAIQDQLYKLFDAGHRGGSIIYAITVVADDELPRLLRIHESIAEHDYLKTSIQLPGATPYGTDGVNQELNVLSQLAGNRIDGSGNRSFYLSAGKSLKVSLSVIPATGKSVIIRVYGEHY